MEQLKFKKELYAKTALIKAAYNYTDIAYIHLDADDIYFYVDIEFKEQDNKITEQDFINEMLAQSVRHEIYKQTKDIRELLLARALSTSLIVDETPEKEENSDFSEDEILKDWFDNEETENK